MVEGPSELILLGLLILLITIIIYNGMKARLVANLGGGTVLFALWALVELSPRRCRERQLGRKLAWVSGLASFPFVLGSWSSFHKQLIIVSIEDSLPPLAGPQLRRPLQSYLTSTEGSGSLQSALCPQGCDY